MRQKEIQTEYAIVVVQFFRVVAADSRRAAGQVSFLGGRSRLSARGGFGLENED
jgi:hypothetical protein